MLQWELQVQNEVSHEETTRKQEVHSEQNHGSSRTFSSSVCQPSPQTSGEAMVDVESLRLVLKRQRKCNLESDQNFNIAIQEELSAFLPKPAHFHLVRIEHDTFSCTVDFEVETCFCPVFLELQGTSIQMPDLEVLVIAQIGLICEFGPPESVLPDDQEGFTPNQSEFLQSENLEADATLLHIFGYLNPEHAANLSVLKSGELIYWLGCNVIICNQRTKMQRIFVGHRSKIACLALEPGTTLVASAELVSSSILLWDSVTLGVLEIVQNTFSGEVRSISFCNNSWNAIAVITAAGTMHDLIIYDWKRKVKLISSPCHFEHEHTSAWNPHCLSLLNQQFVTIAGVQVEFWNICCKQTMLGGGALAMKNRRNMAWNTRAIDDSAWSLSSVVGNYSHDQHRARQLSMAFADQDTLFTGSIGGGIYRWHRCILTNIYESHHGAIRGLSINNNQFSFASFGDDGFIKIWSMDMKKLLAVVLSIRIANNEGESSHLGIIAVRATCTLQDLRQDMVDDSLRPMSNFLILRSRPFQYLVKDLSSTAASNTCELHRVESSRESAVTVCSIHPIVTLVITFDSDAYSRNFFSSQQVKDIDEDAMGPIKSLIWVGHSLAFSFGHAVYSFPDIRDQVLPFAHRLTEGVRAYDHYCALAVHPRLFIFVTATSCSIRNALQLWSIYDKKMISQHVINFTVSSLEFSSDGAYLAAARKLGCTIFCAKNLTVLHEIHYDNSRSACAASLKFSPCSNYLAIGSSDSSIDIFDVYARHKFASWISCKLDLPFDPDALEFDLADGVVLCYLIESLCIMDRHKIDIDAVPKLRQYDLISDRPPLCNAWKNRPSSTRESLALLNGGFRVAKQIADVACRQLSSLVDMLVCHKRERGKLVEGHQLENEMSNKANEFEDSISRIGRKMKILGADSESLQSSKLISESGHLHPRYLFEVLNYLKALEVDDEFKLNRLVTSWQEGSMRLCALTNRETILRKSLDELNTVSKSSSGLATRGIPGRGDTGSDIRREQEMSLINILGLKQEIVLQIDELKRAIKNLAEYSFVAICSCLDGQCGNDFISHMDWSLNCRKLRSCGRDIGTLSIWDPFTGEKLNERPECTEWATCHCFRGWALNNKTRKIPFVCESELISASTSSVISKTHFLSFADHFGAMFLSKYPPIIRQARVCVVMSDDFVKGVNYERFSEMLDNKFLVPLCHLLGTSRARFGIGMTGPNTIDLVIKSPSKEDKDQRFAFQILIELLRSIHSQSHLDQLESWLKYIVSVTGPIRQIRSPHCSAVTNLRSTSDGGLLISMGESDHVLSILKISSAICEKDQMLDKAKATAKSAVDAALVVLRMGEGERIIPRFQDMIVAILSVSVEKEGKDVVMRSRCKKTSEMTLDQIRQELEERRFPCTGLLEKQEFVAQLERARSDPIYMSIAEMRTELEFRNTSCRYCLERWELIELLKNSRLESKSKTILPISLIMDVSSPLLSRGSRSKLEILEIFDAILGIGYDIARYLAVSEELSGICAMLQRHRSILADACFTRRNVHSATDSEQDIHLKNPQAVDFFFDPHNKGSLCPDHLLKKGGELYDLALEFMGGSIPHQEVFEFQHLPRRCFQYHREAEGTGFMDRLVEFKENIDNYKGTIFRVLYHKRLRWGLRFHMSALDKKVHSVLEDEVLEADKCSSALIFQVPLAVPDLIGMAYSHRKLKTLFEQIDMNRLGFLDAEALDLALDKSAEVREVLNFIGRYS